MPGGFNIGNYGGGGGGGGGAGTLPGAGATGYDPATGGVPQIPNPISTQSQAIGGNQMNLQALIALLSGVNNSQQSQLTSNFNTAIPNYQALTQTASSDIGNNLNGQVPPDVINLLTQQAAERGVTTGMPGGPNSNAAYLQALGLTSMGRQDLGVSQLDATRNSASATVAPLFNPASFLVTPEQQQQAQTAANTMAAAPIPSAAAAKAIGLGNNAAPPSNLPWWARPGDGSQYGFGTTGNATTGFHTPNMIASAA